MLSQSLLAVLVPLAQEVGVPVLGPLGGGFPNDLRKVGHLVDNVHGRIKFLETTPVASYVYQ